MTKQTSREKFEAIVKGDPRQNNQVLKRSELHPELYQYDSINFAYKCFCIAESSNQSEIASLREENESLKSSAEIDLKYNRKFRDNCDQLRADLEQVKKSVAALARNSEVIDEFDIKVNRADYMRLIGLIIEEIFS